MHPRGRGRCGAGKFAPSVTRKSSLIFSNSRIKDSLSYPPPLAPIKRLTYNPQNGNPTRPFPSRLSHTTLWTTRHPICPTGCRIRNCPARKIPARHPSRQTYLLKHQTYANLFESALERIMGGTPLQTIVQSDPRGIQLGRFLFWINRDPDRRAALRGGLRDRRGGHGPRTDGHRRRTGRRTASPSWRTSSVSSLRVKARTYLMEKWSPRRYGDTRRVQIDSTTINASMTAEDLTKLSLDELRTMAARVFAQRGRRPATTPTGRGGGIGDAIQALITMSSYCWWHPLALWS